MFMMGLFSESAPDTNITWLLWIALVFFALMVTVGWLVSRRQKPEEEQPHADHEKHETEGHA